MMTTITSQFYLAVFLGVVDQLAQVFFINL